MLLSFTLGPWGPATVQGREGLTRYEQFAIIVHQMYSVQVPSGSTQGHNTNKLRIEHSLQGSSYGTIAPKKKKPLQYMHPLFFCRIALSTELVSCQRKVRRVNDMWVFPGLLSISVLIIPSYICKDVVGRVGTRILTSEFTELSVTATWNYQVSCSWARHFVVDIFYVIFKFPQYELFPITTTIKDWFALLFLLVG